MQQSTCEPNVTHCLSIVEYLTLQLQEIELLESMFANPGEFQMFGDSMVQNIQTYISNKGTGLEPPSHLDFTINMSVDIIKLRICIHLPHKYPAEEPEVFVRSDQLSRMQETEFNVNLNKMIQTLERGSVCLYTVVDWIQENLMNFYSSEEKQPRQESSIPRDLKKFESFTRYWIYSHHIYSKVKRRAMLELSSDFNITGFILPGKPGIVCIEGTSVDCEDWWYRIRNMTWKRIVVKKNEQIAVKGVDMGDVFDLHRKFSDFKELAFPTSNTRDYHMDMGAFYKYLVDKDCGYIFKEFFGFEGKS